MNRYTRRGQAAERQEQRVAWDLPTALDLIQRGAITRARAIEGLHRYADTADDAEPHERNNMHRLIDMVTQHPVEDWRDELDAPWVIWRDLAAVS